MREPRGTNKVLARRVMQRCSWVGAAVFGRCSMLEGVEHGPRLEGVGDSNQGGVIGQYHNAAGVLVPQSMFLVLVIRSGVLARASELARLGKLDDSYIVGCVGGCRRKLLEMGVA